MLEVRLTDHREAIGDFSKLEIFVDSLRVKRKSRMTFQQSGWTELKPVAEKVDLTRAIAPRSITIFKGEVSDGAVEGLHLKLKKITGVLKKKNAPAAVKDVVEPIQLAFSLASKDQTLIVLDLVVLDVTDHPPAGYEVHIKGYEVYKDGKLVEQAPKKE